MGQFQEAEKALKEALKLDNDDQQLETILREVMIINRNKVDED